MRHSIVSKTLKQLWGVVYGEYKGAVLKSKIFLAAGIGAYAVGILLLTYALYC